ncbi:MAG: hypothetical protein ABI658_21485 [Acidimicrobiales bacterium]
MSHFDAGPSAGLEGLLADLSAAVSAAPRDVLGRPVAIALRYRVDNDRFFLSGVPHDLLQLVSAAFHAPLRDGPGGTAVADENWIVAGLWHLGTGPVQPPTGGNVVRLRRAGFEAPAVAPANRLDEARALRAWFEAGAARLVDDLQDPPNFARLSEIGRAAPADLQAVLCDVGRSRAHLGRYLLDAGDYFDDERIDQLGDGYVNAAQLWFEVAAHPDADIGAQLLSLENECAQWMQRAAEPPTRYAF